MKFAFIAALALMGLGYAVYPAHAGQCVTSCHPSTGGGSICTTQCY